MPRGAAHQTYSSFEFQVAAISSASLFSTPSPAWLEKGRLSGSAQTRSSPADMGAGRWAASPAPPARAERARASRAGRRSGMSIFQYTHPGGQAFRRRRKRGATARESPAGGQDRGGSASDPPLSDLLSSTTGPGPGARPAGGRLQPEHAQDTALSGELARIAERTQRAQARGRILSADTRGDADARPATDARQHVHVLLAVRTTVGAGVANDARRGLELPQQLAGLLIHGLEPAFHRAVERQAASGGQRPAVRREVFLQIPDDLA